MSFNCPIFPDDSQDTKPCDYNRQSPGNSKTDFMAGIPASYSGSEGVLSSGFRPDQLDGSLHDIGNVGSNGSHGALILVKKGRESQSWDR